MSVIVAKWTIDEYHRMIDAGILSDRKVELLKGEIVEIFAEGEPHAYNHSQDILCRDTILPASLQCLFMSFILRSQIPNIHC